MAVTQAPVTPKLTPFSLCCSFSHPQQFLNNPHASNLFIYLNLVTLLACDGSGKFSVLHPKILFLIPHYVFASMISQSPNKGLNENKQSVKLLFQALKHISFNFNIQKSIKQFSVCHMYHACLSSFCLQVGPPLCTYSCTPVPADSVSTVSVIHGLPRSPQKIVKKINNSFICFKMCTK
jgi:hypothetical protein